MTDRIIHGVNIARTTVIFFFLMSLFTAIPAFSDQTDTKEQKDARMAWWREARFGMFIHWGVYSVPAGTYDGKQYSHIGEWIMNDARIPVDVYKQYAKEFDPVDYDPDKWVQLAKQAGMKYIVITAKHHDGFAMFDTDVTDWNIVDATPYGKDIIKPLAEACKKYGIKFGVYYSQALDWCAPGGAVPQERWDNAQNGNMDSYIDGKVIPQVTELLTNYGAISYLWWDTPFEITKERADMIGSVLMLQPNIITNDRLGGGYSGDVQTPEQHIPGTGSTSDWETCMTMNDTWGYKSFDNNWKSTKDLVRNLIDIASKGGNYLLNIGPDSLGNIPQPSIERLAEIGKWMDLNGESIYGTSSSPFVKLPWGRCTRKNEGEKTILYFHVFDRTEDHQIFVPGLFNRIDSAVILGSELTPRIKYQDFGINIELPEETQSEIATVVKLEINSPLKIVPILPGQDDDGVVQLTAEYAIIYNQQGSFVQLEDQGGIYNIGFWTDSRIPVEWKFKIGEPGKFKVSATMAIKEPASTISVSVAGNEISTELKSTGSYGNFADFELGTFDIASAGECALKLQPVKDKWNPVNVRTITLTPVK